MHKFSRASGLPLDERTPSSLKSFVTGSSYLYLCRHFFFFSKKTRSRHQGYSLLGAKFRESLHACIHAPAIDVSSSESRTTLLRHSRAPIGCMMGCTSIDALRIYLFFSAFSAFSKQLLYLLPAYSFYLLCAAADNENAGNMSSTVVLCTAATKSRLTCLQRVLQFCSCIQEHPAMRRSFFVNTQHDGSSSAPLPPSPSTMAQGPNNTSNRAVQYG